MPIRRSEHVYESEKNIIDESYVKICCPECRSHDRHLNSCSKMQRCKNCKQPANIHLVGCRPLDEVYDVIGSIKNARS